MKSHCTTWQYLHRDAEFKVSTYECTLLWCGQCVIHYGNTAVSVSSLYWNICRMWKSDQMDFMQAQYGYDGYLASFYRKEVHRLLVPFQLNTGLMCLSVFRKHLKYSKNYNSKTNKQINKYISATWQLNWLKKCGLAPTYYFLSLFIYWLINFF